VCLASLKRKHPPLLLLNCYNLPLCDRLETDFRGWRCPFNKQKQQMKIKLSTLGLAMLSISGLHAQYTGPSSSASSYITPTASNWYATSLLTVGDSISGYKMVGIPDGLGAYDNNNGSITLLMNHELGSTVGTTRAHGSIGAFVSKWTIDKNTLAVTAGQDLIQSASDMYTWNGSAYVAGTTVINRLCSADLPAMSAFYNSNTSTGYDGRIFMNGEESGVEGRAFGFVATGTDAGKAYELPYLGRFSWENSIANPHTGDKTIVMGNDDSTPGQVYMYEGTKSNTGSAIEKAGLSGGTLSGIKVTNGGANYANGAVAKENNGAINGTFTLASVSQDLTNTSTRGNATQTASTAAGITEFARPEDGVWLDADTYLFVTTGGNVTTIQTSKLYRLDFSDASNLSAGGSISMVLDRADLDAIDGQDRPAGVAMFDNMTVGLDGKVYIQEDPGNYDYNALTWQVDLTNPTAAVKLFESDATRFVTGGANFLTKDEENSGIIDVTSLFSDAAWYTTGAKAFLSVTQSHLVVGGELVEGGQLQLITNGVNPVPEPSTWALIGIGAFFILWQVRRKQNA
jgi:hypothetical protein